MSLNAVAHVLVFANRRRKMNRLIAAVGSSFLSSQQPAVFCQTLCAIAVAEVANKEAAGRRVWCYPDVSKP